MGSGMTEDEHCLLSLLKLKNLDNVLFEPIVNCLKDSFWESYSALANTNGGHIVVGLRRCGKEFIVSCLDEQLARAVTNNIVLYLQDKQVISSSHTSSSGIYTVDFWQYKLVVVRVNKASYKKRPVYLNAEPLTNTYMLDADQGVYLCSKAQVKGMMADANLNSCSLDSRILKGFNIEQDLDADSLTKYRRAVDFARDNSSLRRLSNLNFLKKIGAYARNENTGDSGLTVAGLLMFGKYSSIIKAEALPNYMVDYRYAPCSYGLSERISCDETKEEMNLFNFYYQIACKLNHAIPNPFIMENCIRYDVNPGHYAAYAALIHCFSNFDVNARGNITVRWDDEKLIFSYPGRSLVSNKDFFSKGSSICRNQTIYKMFLLMTKKRE